MTFNNNPHFDIQKTVGEDEYFVKQELSKQAKKSKNSLSLKKYYTKNIDVGLVKFELLVQKTPQEFTVK